MSVLTAEERKQHGQLTRKLLAACFEIQEIPNGMAFAFPINPERLQQLAGWISAERRCCPFLSFSLTLPAGGDRVEMRLTGPPGTQELLRQEFATQRIQEAD